MQVLSYHAQTTEKEVVHFMVIIIYIYIYIDCPCVIMLR